MIECGIVKTAGRQRLSLTKPVDNVIAAMCTPIG